MLNLNCSPLARPARLDDIETVMVADAGANDGRFATRAQVCLSGDTNEKPLSSSSASTAFSSRRLFFYLWQHIFFPLGNRFFIPLKRSPLWTLATPAHPVKNVPDCTRMTSNANAAI